MEDPRVQKYYEMLPRLREIKLLYALENEELYQYLASVPDKPQVYSNLHYCFNDTHQRHYIDAFAYHNAFVLLYQDGSGKIYGLVELTLHEDHEWDYPEDYLLNPDVANFVEFYQQPTFPDSFVESVHGGYDGQWNFSFRLISSNCELNGERLWQFNEDPFVNYELTMIDL